MENTTQAAFAYFDKLANMKKNIENNKLNSRKDVQVLRKKIAILNQELIFLKRNMEQAKLAHEHATGVYKTKCEMHKQFLNHLTIISDKHNEQQKIKAQYEALQSPQDDKRVTNMSNFLSMCMMIAL